VLDIALAVTDGPEPVHIEYNPALNTTMNCNNPGGNCQWHFKAPLAYHRAVA
jgi:hypothetical protein